MCGVYYGRRVADSGGRMRRAVPAWVTIFFPTAITPVERLLLPAPSARRGRTLQRSEPCPTDLNWISFVVQRAIGQTFIRYPQPAIRHITLSW